MKVGIFYSSISNPTKFSNKISLMDNFAQGVREIGDVAVEFRDRTIFRESLDAGFVLGYTLENNHRRQIIDQLKQTKTPAIFVDSNILHYARSEHEWHRYSLNSVYPNDGVYFFNDLDQTKWTTYSSWHGVTLKPWRTGNSQQHILILCQRPKGWNMFGNDQDLWLQSTIAQIRQIDRARPIVVRMHPGDGARQDQIDRIKHRYSSRDRVTISTSTNICDDLINCWCTVGYNSTPNVVAAIEGVPVYIKDPVHSWAADVAFTSLEMIKDPPMPDRSEWVHKIANIHWSNQEVRSGRLWTAIRQYISSVR